MVHTTRLTRISISHLVVVATFLLIAGPASAQFGKNKVKYNNFDFRVLQTEHFDIHYYPEAEVAIHDAARMAERAYARLSKVFRHDWKKRKPLILYASQSDFQQTNIFRFQISDGTGGITEGLRNRIVLFFPSAYPEFEHTLTHELVHAFQFDIMRRGALSRGSNPFAFRAPLWFMEGMAEYLSTGEIDPLTAMWLRDASLAGYLTSLDELSRVGDIRVYRFGQAIWYYLGTKYGDEKVGEIMQKAPLMGVEEAFRNSLNVTLEELSDDWLNAVRLTYMPQIVDHPHAEDFATRLTNHATEGASINIAPALSPDGRRVAFISDRDFFNDIYISDLDEPDHPRKVLSGERTDSFESLRFLRVGMAFSPDGQFLTFSSKVGEQDAVYIMRVRDKKIVDVHRFGLDGIETPSFSPDGQQIVFTAQSGGVSDLYVVNLDGTNLRRLTDDRFAQRDPVWSPDGTRIAFTTEFGPGTDFDLLSYNDYQIGLYDLASGDVEFLPAAEGKSINPQWGPEGSRIAFISDRDGISNLYLYDFDEEATYQLTDLLTGVSGIIESSPAFSWSADGSRIVFSAFSDAGWDLYQLDDPLDLAVTPWEPAEESEFDLATRAFERGTRQRTDGTDSADDSVDLADIGDRAEGVKDDGDEAVAEGDVATVEGADGDAEADAEIEEVAAAGPPDAVSYYLGGRGEQAARRRGGIAAGGLPSFSEPVDIGTLLGDPTIGLPRDTTQFVSKDYELHFSPDAFSTPQIGFVTGLGAFGASQLAFSDLLGDHNMYISASVFGSLTDSDLFFTYANLKRRFNWGLSTFQFRSDFAPFATSASTGEFLFRSDVFRGVQAFGSYPFSRFRRIEFGGVFTHIDRRVASLDLGPFASRPDIVEDLENDTYLAPSVAWVYDNSFFGSTGPIGGARRRFELQRAFGSETFTQVYADWRKYWLMGKRYTIASRALFLGLFDQGFENARIQSIGGPTLLRGYDFRDGRLRGTEVGLLNLEFRFPIVERPGGFPPLRGALWYDVGFARCGVCGRLEDGVVVPGASPFQFATTKDAGPLGFRLVDGRASFGAGVRLNLFGFAVVRLDLARQTDMAELQDTEFIFTLSPEF